MGTGAKVLIAEANQRLATRLAQELEALGLEVEHARTGAAAFGAFAKGDYALLLVDLVLPQISGAELVRRVRGTPKGASARIALMSPNLKDPASVDQLITDQDLGPYFRMPFNFGFFRQTVEKYLAGERAGLSAVEQHRVARELAEQRAAVKGATNGSAAAAPAPQVPPTAAPATPARQPSTPPPPPPPPQTAAAPANGIGATLPAPAARQSAAEPEARGSRVLEWGADRKLQSFDQVLKELRRERFHGHARIESDGAQKLASFVSGLPISAVALHPMSPFSEFEGLIEGFSPEEREAFSAVHEFGDALLAVQMGALEWEKLLEQKRRYIAMQLGECFGWSRGGVRLDPLPAGPASVIAPILGLPTYVAAFVEGAARLTGDDEALNALERQLAPRFLSRSRNFYELVRFINPEDGVVSLNGKLNPNEPFAEVMRGTSDRTAWLRLVRAMLLLGMLKASSMPGQDEEAPFPFRRLKAETTAPPSAAPVVQAEERPETLAEDKLEIIDLGSELLDDLDDVVEGIRGVGADAAAQKQAEEARKLEDALIDELERVKRIDYYKMFDQTRGRFKFQDAKKRYFELQGKFSPDKFIMSSGEMMSKCEEYLEILSKAFETLSDVSKKMEYDQRLEKERMIERDRRAGGGIQADIAFQSGKALIDEGDFEGAQRQLREAMQLGPGNTEHELWMARAIHLANRYDRATQVRARQMLDKILGKNPKLSMAYAFRAAIFNDQGNFPLAASDLGKALIYDPTNRIARDEQRRMEQLQQKR